MLVGACTRHACAKGNGGLEDPYVSGSEVVDHFEVLRPANTPRRSVLAARPSQSRRLTGRVAPHHARARGDRALQ